MVMSRLPKTFMVPKPLEPLNLEEMKFWLAIMEEHALFVKAGLPNDSVELINEAQCFYQEFKDLRLKAERVQSDKKFSELVSDSREAATEFFCYLRRLLHFMMTCRLGGHNFPLFLDHLSRETEYFLRLLSDMQQGKKVLNGCTKAREDMFWLRIMADHAKFICHLLDPSEENLIAMSQDFAREFDVLYLQGRDLASMQAYCEEAMAFRRFLQDVRAAVARMRDFNKAAYDLIEECKLLGLIPAMMADHLRREAEHFLMLLSLMEKGILKNAPLTCDEEVFTVEGVDAVIAQDWEEPTAAPCVEDEEEIWPEEREVEEGEATAESVSLPEPKGPAKFSLPEEREEETELPVLPTAKKEPPKKESPMEEKVEVKKKNTKWGDKWPKPLGR